MRDEARGRESLDSRRRQADILKIAQDGTIHDSLPLSLQTGSIAPSERAQASLVAISLPAPAALLASGLSVAIFNPDHGVWATLVSLLLLSWPLLAGVLALSIVLAVIAWRWARAFGLSPARADRLGGFRAALWRSRIRRLLAPSPLAGSFALSALPGAIRPRSRRLRRVR